MPCNRFAESGEFNVKALQGMRKNCACASALHNGDDALEIRRVRHRKEAYR